MTTPQGQWVNSSQLLTLPAMDPRHGRYTTYANHACRCLACTEAFAAYRKAQRQRGIAPDDPRHGKYSTYCNYGCRCIRCTKAAHDYHQSRRRTA